ncbi:hypothetical protein D3C81_1568490 [compost metagenome]
MRSASMEVPPHAAGRPGPRRAGSLRPACTAAALRLHDGIRRLPRRHGQQPRRPLPPPRRLSRSAQRSPARGARPAGHLGHGAPVVAAGAGGTRSRSQRHRARQPARCPAPRAAQRRAPGKLPPATGRAPGAGPAGPAPGASRGTGAGGLPQLGALRRPVSAGQALLPAKHRRLAARGRRAAGSGGQRPLAGLPPARRPPHPYRAAAA